MRLDYVRAYNSNATIQTTSTWPNVGPNSGTNGMPGHQSDMIQAYLLKRQRTVSSFHCEQGTEISAGRFQLRNASHTELDRLQSDRGIQFFPVDSRSNMYREGGCPQSYPGGRSGCQDYLWTIALTMGRMSEINRLTWQEVNFEQRCVSSTLEKRGAGTYARRSRCRPSFSRCFHAVITTETRQSVGVLAPVLEPAKGVWVIGPYRERKHIMKTLCENARVRYFRYHAIRHFGASMLDQAKVPIGSIQRILGHENRTTTEIYLHSIGDSERQAIDILDENFKGFSHTDSQ